MPLALDQKVGAVVWSPLGWGRLTGKIRRGQPLPEVSRLRNKLVCRWRAADRRRVPLWCRRRARRGGRRRPGKTVPQIALNWLLQRPSVAKRDHRCSQRGAASTRTSGPSAGPRAEAASRSWMPRARRSCRIPTSTRPSSTSAIRSCRAVTVAAWPRARGAHRALAVEGDPVARAGQASTAVASGAAACKSAVVLILCDFDGTITCDDLTNRIWDAHLRYDWRQALLAPAASGELTPFELLRRGYADVDRPAASSWASCARRRAAVGLRGSPGPVAHRAWVFHVISHGLPSYVREFARRRAPGVLLLRCRLRWALARGPCRGRCRLGPLARIFKIRVLDQLKAATSETL